MADCNFNIPFSGDPETILGKARKAVESQSGEFNGDLNSGSFSVSVFGNSIAGSYTVNGNDLNIIIDKKPFMIPCSAIESFLKNQVT